MTKGELEYAKRSALQLFDSNTPNRVMELVRDETLFRKLLLYNGIDSLVTYRLAMLQMKELGLVS